jgi:hypothetical protein
MEKVVYPPGQWKARKEREFGTTGRKFFFINVYYPLRDDWLVQIV